MLNILIDVDNMQVYILFNQKKKFAVFIHSYGKNVNEETKLIQFIGLK